MPVRANAIFTRIVELVQANARRVWRRAAVRAGEPSPPARPSRALRAAVALARDAAARAVGREALRLRREAFRTARRARARRGAAASESRRGRAREVAVRNADLKLDRPANYLEVGQVVVGLFEATTAVMYTIFWT
eukprot:2078638-Pleurochrysis_carterae.AAC.2